MIIGKIKIDIPLAFRKSKNRRLKIRLAPEISSSVDVPSGVFEFEKCSSSIEEAVAESGYQVSVEWSKLKINMDLLERSKSDAQVHLA